MTMSALLLVLLLVAICFLWLKQPPTRKPGDRARDASTNNRDEETTTSYARPKGQQLPALDGRSNRSAASPLYRTSDSYVVHPRHEDHPLYELTQAALTRAADDIGTLRSIAERLEDERIKAQLDKLILLAEEISSRLQENPGSLPAVQRHFDYYLHTARKLLEKYEQLLASPYYTKEMEYQVKRIEELLEPLEMSFRRYLRKLVQEELLALEVEVNTLEQVMRRHT